MEKGYSRTNLYVINEKLWNWAKFQSNTLGKQSVSEYVFDLIQTDYIKKSVLELGESKENPQ